MREPYALKGARTVPGRGEGGNTLSLFDILYVAGVPRDDVDVHHRLAGGFSHVRADRMEPLVEESFCLPGEGEVSPPGALAPALQAIAFHWKVTSYEQVVPAGASHSPRG